MRARGNEHPFSLSCSDSSLGAFLISLFLAPLLVQDRWVARRAQGAQCRIPQSPPGYASSSPATPLHSPFTQLFFFCFLHCSPLPHTMEDTCPTRVWVHTPWHIGLDGRGGVRGTLLAVRPTSPPHSYALRSTPCVAHVLQWSRFLLFFPFISPIFLMMSTSARSTAYSMR